LDAEYPIDQISYDAVYLYKLCKTDETDNDKSRRFLARHFIKLTAFMESNIAEFEEFAKDINAKYWLCFVSDESSGKKRNEHFPQLNSIEKTSTEIDTGASTIDYRVSQLKDTPRLVKRFANFKYDGRTRWTPPFLIALTYVAFIVLLFYYFQVQVGYLKLG
jgi:hypothetical protein